MPSVTSAVVGRLDGGQHLVAVHQDGVGVGAADVDADAHAHATVVMARGHRLQRPGVRGQPSLP